MKRKSSDKITCPGCGAANPGNAGKCSYCGTPLSGIALGMNAFRKMIGSHALAAQAALVGLISSSAWLFEAPGSWWDSDRAVFMWLGVTPLASCIMGFLTKDRSATALKAIIFFLAGGLPLLLGVMIKIGHFNDDAAGLFGGVGVGAAAGFLIGRLLRRMGASG